MSHTTSSSIYKGAKKLMSEKQIDQICCMTTNDPYVLDLWRKELGESEILFLSDGNNEFLLSLINKKS